MKVTILPKQLNKLTEFDRKRIEMNYPSCCRVLSFILVSLLLVSCQSNELSKSDSSAGLNGSFELTDSGYPINWAFFPNPESGDLFQVTADTSKAYEGNQSLKLVTDQSDVTVGFRSRRMALLQKIFGGLKLPNIRVK